MPLFSAATTPFSCSERTFRVAQEPNWNWKPEPSEPFFPKPKAEPEPPEPFSRNRNRNRSRPFLLKWSTENPFLQRNRRNRKPEPLEPFHPQTVTEPNRTGASLGHFNLCGFKKALLQNPREMIRGRNFSEMSRVSAPKVRVNGQKSELQTKSRSYSRGDPQNPNRITQKRDPNGVQVLLQKPALKPSFESTQLWILCANSKCLMTVKRKPPVWPIFSQLLFPDFKPNF